MSEISPEIKDGFRRNRAAILKALAATTQARASMLTGISEPTLSRMKDGVGEKAAEIDRVAAVMAACGLVVQPITHMSISPERLSALKVLARVALDDDAPTTDFGALE